MIGKGFPDTWINWIMHTVHGGRVCVSVNGHRTDYFRTFQGLRQGDPLSPLLFNLVADALSSLLDKAVNKGLIMGVLADLISGGGYHTSNMLTTLLL